MSLAPAEFLDTNVLIYAFSTDPRTETAEKLLAKGCAISLQGLNEFANVAHRKLGLSWAEVGEAIGIVRALCPKVLPIDLRTHETALEIATRYRLGFFDALMISSALRGECRIFWSEDMHHGLEIEGGLVIANPFRATSSPQP